MSDELERRVRTLLDGIQPSPEAAERVRAAALRAVAARRRRRSRRSRLLAAVVTVLALSAGAATATVVLSGGDRPAVPAGAQARAAIAESAVLARAPWLFQPNGSPLIQTERLLPSLSFPAGTSYNLALRRLLRSVTSRGALPPGTRLGPPLPRGVVWSPSASGRPARLDLTAPFGFTRPEGRIRGPSYSLDPTTTRRQAGAILQAFSDGRPAGERLSRLIDVDVPTLGRCQILPRPAPCRLAGSRMEG